MKTIQYMLACALATITLLAQDGDFIASDSYVVFEASNDAPKATLSFENNSSADINVGSLSLIGAHGDEFNITSDGCSGVTLAADGSCDVEVAFVPKNNGIKNALLEVPYDSKNLYVFLTNDEDTRHNVIKRLSPVVYDINISEQLEGAKTYELKWSLVGYHSDYKAMVVMFDCTGVAEGECGANYSDNEKFLDSGLMNAVSSEPADWSYYDQNATKFDYSYVVNMPAQRANGDDWNATGTDVVVRFYVLSAEDEKNNKASLSLIIPGKLAERYYDTSGRKIEKTMCPSGGCNQ